MSRNPTSPKITTIAWGTVTVEGHSGRFKDVKLYPGGAREWDWKETGTKHTPGIQPADVKELLEKGAEAVILSRGKDGALHVMPETLDYLEKNNVMIHVHLTDKAVNLYNQLTDSVPVGALIHSTC